MFILGDLAGPAVAPHPDQPAQKLASARAHALALLRLAGDADGREPQTHRPGIELVGLALAVERDGRDQKALLAGGGEFTLEQ